MAQYSIKEAADKIRGANAHLQGLADQTVVDRFLESHPEQHQKIYDTPLPMSTLASARARAPQLTPIPSGIPTTEPEPIPKTDAEETPEFSLPALGLRTIPGIVGYGVGGVLGSALGPGGTVGGAMLGGAAMSGIGDWLAQKVEGRDEWNPSETIAHGVLGGVPFAKTGKLAMAGLQAAGHGAAGTVGLDWASGGPAPWEDPIRTAKNIAIGGTGGAVLGVGTQALMNRFLRAGGAPQVAKAVDELTPTPDMPQRTAATIDERIRQTTGGGGGGPAGQAPIIKPTGPTTTGPPKLRGQTAEGRQAQKIIDDIVESPVEPLGRVDRLIAQSDEAMNLSDPTRRSLYERVMGKIQDYKLPVRNYIKEIEKRFPGARRQPGSMSAADDMDLEIGGIYSKQQRATETIERHLRNVKEDGLNPAFRGIETDVNRLIVLDSMDHHVGILNERQLANFAKGKLDTTAMDGVFPQGFNAERVVAERVALQSSMSPEKWAQVKLRAQEIYDFNRETLDILRDSGRITPEFYAKLAKREGGYTPLLRFLDATEQGILTKSAQKANQSLGPLKKFKGSEKAMRNPREASLAYRHSALEEAGRNEAGRAFLRYHGTSAEMADAFPILREAGEDLPVTGRNFVAKTKEELDTQFGDVGGWSTFSVFDNGIEVNVAAPAYVTNAISLMHPQMASMVGEGALAFFGGITRRMATSANLGFSVTNVARDWVDMAILGRVLGKDNGNFWKFTSEWFSLLPQQLKRAFRDPRTAVRGRDAFLQAGAGGSTQAIEINPRGFLKIDELESAALNSWGKVKNTLDRKLFGTIEKFSNVLEENTKLAAWNMMTGTSGGRVGRKLSDEARRKVALEIRRYGGSPDFAVRGSQSRQYNALILFFNAQMQGIMRNVRGFGRLTEKGQRKRVGYLMAGVLGTELLRNQMNRAYVDSDGTPSMDRITDSDEENYFSFVIPFTETIDGVERYRILKMSKGHAARPIFNPVASLIRNADREVTEAGPQRGRRGAGQIAVDVASQFLPGSFNIRTDKPILREVARGIAASLNPILKIPIEQMQNRQMFSDIPMVPRRMESLSPSEQYLPGETNPAAIATAAALKKVGIDWSPMRIESGIQSAFPGPGEMLTGAAGATVQAATGELSPQEALTVAAEEVIDPIRRRFKGSPGDQLDRDQQSVFYEMLEKSNGAQALLKRYEMEGDLEGFKKAQEENHNLLVMRLPLNRIARKLGQIRRLPDEQRVPLQRQLLTQAMRLMNPLTKDNLEKFYRNYEERD